MVVSVVNVKNVCTNQAIRVPEVHHYGSAEYQQAEAEESSDLDGSSATISSGEER